MLIDGPSGSGKSTLADRLVEGWGAGDAPTLVRMDSIYPGWDGLRLGHEIAVAELLAPLAAGGAGARPGYPVWDWVRDRVDHRVEVDPDAPLILEGCGALGRASAPLGTLRLWIDAELDFRRGRALERDGAVYAAHWDRWQGQFERYVSAEDPSSLADLGLCADARGLRADARGFAADARGPARDDRGGARDARGGAGETP